MNYFLIMLIVIFIMILIYLDFTDVVYLLLHKNKSYECAKRRFFRDSKNCLKDNFEMIIPIKTDLTDFCNYIKEYNYCIVNYQTLYFWYALKIKYVND